jgi:hypothetical protein
MDRELRQLHQGAREERRRLTPDPQPPRRPPEPDQRGPPLRTERDLEPLVYHTVCDNLVEPDPADMTFYCPTCDARIDPTEYH